MARGKLTKIIGGIVGIAIIAGIGYAVYRNANDKDKDANQNLILSLSSTPRKYHFTISIRKSVLICSGNQIYLYF